MFEFIQINNLAQKPPTTQSESPSKRFGFYLALMQWVRHWNDPPK